ncbi:MAG: hypothetical protein R3B45_09550 [Bdellovibrionota bacterium]
MHQSFMLTISAYILGKHSFQLAFGKSGQRLSLFMFIWLIIFYVSPYIGLKSINDSTIGGVAFVFEAITGKNPYTWAKGIDRK